MTRFATAAELEPYQQGLPLPDAADGRLSAPRATPAEAVEQRRAIHISGYDADVSSAPTAVIWARPPVLRKRAKLWTGASAAAAE